jgi:hypothetical protein
MKANPMKDGVLTENSAGIGTVTRKMVRERAVELAVINGRSAQDVSKSDREQAQRELTGEPDTDPKQVALESAPESERWDQHGNVVGVVSAKLNASAALAASGAIPENVNYAVKSSLLLSFLESVPEISAKLRVPISAERKLDDVVQSAQAAAVLVLVY